MVCLCAVLEQVKYICCIRLRCPQLSASESCRPSVFFVQVCARPRCAVIIIHECCPTAKHPLHLLAHQMHTAISLVRQEKCDNVFLTNHVTNKQDNFIAHMHLAMSIVRFQSLSCSTDPVQHVGLILHTTHPSFHYPAVFCFRALQC